ncbi:MAG: hypothetical protein JNK25_15215 [Phycisphaerae bacterium]|nr:hypothetical protein [Phycisphaerae bacterium]
MRFIGSRPLHAAACLAAVGIFAGCETPTATDQGPQIGSSGPPGVEVAWLVVDDRIVPPAPPPPPVRAGSPGSDAAPKPPPPDTTMTLEAALAPYADRPVPLPDTCLEAWKACGFDVYSIPAADVPSLRRVLRLAGPEQRQMVLATGKWSEIARGAECRGVQPVQTDAGEFDVRGGLFRLLMRCWAAPGGEAGTTGMLQVEFVPQHLDAANVRPGGGSQTAPPGIAPAREGTNFERLFCDANLARESVLLITSKATLPAADPASSDRPFGPAIPEATSLARAILTDAMGGGEGRVRRVLILTATPPDGFALTGR